MKKKKQEKFEYEYEYEGKGVYGCTVVVSSLAATLATTAGDADSPVEGGSGSPINGASSSTVTLYPKTSLCKKVRNVHPHVRAMSAEKITSSPTARSLP